MWDGARGVCGMSGGALKLLGDYLVIVVLGAVNEHSVRQAYSHPQASHTGGHLPYDQQRLCLPALLPRRRRTPRQFGIKDGIALNQLIEQPLRRVAGPAGGIEVL